MATVIKAIDISKWNGDLDFAKLASLGVAAAIVRAGIGGTQDEKLDTYITAAKRNGMKVGAYYVPYVKTVKGVTATTLKADAKAEAKACAAMLCPFALDFPVFADWEYTNDTAYSSAAGKSLNAYGRTLFIKTFCTELEKLGKKAGIYTNPDYIENKLQWSSLKSYPLFLAKYLYNDNTSWKAVSSSLLPSKYSTAKLWQFGKGAVDGQLLDLDWLYI